MRSPKTQRSLLVGTVSALAVLGCSDQPDAPCLVGPNDSSAYLVQLRPIATFPEQCPQGTQYQMIYAHQYTPYGSTDPGTIVFHLAGSQVKPPSGAEAVGKFSAFQITPPSNECNMAEMTPALDDSVTPANAPAPVTSATYRLSDVRVLSDTAHRGNQFEAAAVVDYGVAGCTDVHYTAQAVFPIATCVDDWICLPDAVATDIPSPGGRGLGSGLSADYRAFCNLDPALIDNPEMRFSMTTLFEQYPLTRPGVPPGRGAYTDPQGNKHDVGVCFLADPFPSLCPPGSTLSKSGPCVVGPASNPH